MPALQRRNPSSDLRRAKLSDQMQMLPVMKTSPYIPAEDTSDVATPKQLAIPTAQHSQLPIHYESDEESVSPSPDDYEDPSSSFSDLEIDVCIDLGLEEIPSIGEARCVFFIRPPSRPAIVNISKLAPMASRSTLAHARPLPRPSHTSITKTSIGRQIVTRSTGNGFQPAVVALSKPPTRFRVPPPVPPRNVARVGSPATPTASQYQIFHQRDLAASRESSHVPRRSVSTVGTRASMEDSDDARFSIDDDSSFSSAPSSVADTDDLNARHQDIGMCPRYIEEEGRQNSTALHEQQDVELQRAINDYYTWRSEGSPGEPPESVYRLSREDRQMVRDHEEEEWRRELERGLTTPTPIKPAICDRFGVSTPTLTRPRAPFRGECVGKLDSNRSKGLRRGFGMAKRAV